MTKIEYTSLNLPKALVEELKIWRMAFCASYGRSVSYGEMIRGMLDCLAEIEPNVVEELDRLVQRNPSLLEKMRNYYGPADEETMKKLLT